MSRYDTDDILGMAAALSALKGTTECLEQTLKKTERWAACRRALGSFYKTFEILLTTVPEKKLRSLKRNLECAKVKVFMGAQASDKQNGESIVMDEDMKVLIEAVHEQCKLCTKESRNRCDMCKYGKTLDSVIAYDREQDSYNEIDLVKLL